MRKCQSRNDIGQPRNKLLKQIITDIGNRGESECPVNQPEQDFLDDKIQDTATNRLSAARVYSNGESSKKERYSLIRDIIKKPDFIQWRISGKKPGQVCRNIPSITDG